MNRSDEARWRAIALPYFARAGIVLTSAEARGLEIADFGLGRFEEVGLSLHTYVNTRRVCAKELVLLPWQLCPEHSHPPVDGELGKEETFRCRWGTVHLFVDVDEEVGTRSSLRRPPDHPYLQTVSVTAANHVTLLPGEQFTLAPDTLHWFMAGPEGAVVSEFSTRSRDAHDVFTDPQVRRQAIDGS